MRLDRFLGQHKALGRRTVRQLVAAGRVRVDGRVVLDGHMPVDRFTLVHLDNDVLQQRAARYLMLHKPAGCVSATRDPTLPTVLDLINGDTSDLHLAGRLDFNTTGLLLLTNDGRWSRRLTDPLGKWPKVYRVSTEEPITREYITAFAEGIYFRYENLVTLPAKLEILDTLEARLTLHEGRYHHVKRLFGAFSNRVLTLHRESIGPIALDPALAPGQYRALTDDEIHPRRQEPEKAMNVGHNDPLHGVTLERIVTELQAQYGWPELARRVPVRCFQYDPSVKSSLVFLRRTPWARDKVEALYRELLAERRQ